MKKLLSLCLPLVLASAGTVQAQMDNQAIEARIDQLLPTMSVKEKVGQLALRDFGMYDAKQLEDIKQQIRDGEVGGFLNVSFSSVDKNAFASLQKIAIEESPHGIPLIFGQDVIHGYETIFPIPLGQAASWNPELIEQGARIAAREATADGIRWTFAPMIDISRDPRWGRIAETLGEDPYLASVLGVAMTRGFQTDDPSQPDAMAASAKHFVGYGAAEAGKDYNAAYIPEATLRDVYLPPFKAAIDAGLMTIMSSYNTLNDIPATANEFALKTLLREEWGFDGFVVSDWNAVMEMIPHGFARDAKHAAELAANAGVDFEMYTDTYRQHLPALIKEGKFSEQKLDAAVRHMLRIKMRLGLWENPYPAGNRDAIVLSDEHLQAARVAARESFVLLKNAKQLLPLKKNTKVALIGPLANAPHEQLGTWIYNGNKKDSHPLLPALQAYLGNDSLITYVPGLEFSRDTRTAHFDKAVKAAQNADVVVYVGGEESILSGEGHSRGDIALPGAQQQLIRRLSETGKPLVTVLLAGRPIELGDVREQSQALMMAWHPGTMAGPALVDVLYGEVSPLGRLPLTWPKAEGQIPVYYNHMATGRPPTDDNYTRIGEIEVGVFQHAPGNSANHLDYGHTPEFPFGFGLTYGEFSYSDLTIATKTVPLGGTIKASATVKNTGKVAATEIVQLYVQDIVGSRTRPVRELKGFKRVSLKPGESQTVEFNLHTDALAFHNQAMEKVTEPGDFNLWIAKDSASGLQGEFTVTATQP
ncbi:beta-glucosidase BglX [Gilvimarinus algae]|uniref:beta-glucosidase n=1 Tax=Gilvimarinus algae TaxID=3058037 RepID=A0ABT8TK32_9GAMM|nr:beta-glucosidase BglX [Gilvimarinus sp. SDUM040014]MDO3383723.1 beta-glucosidase BglX [Gilvimarinus sp. SDUM040014]